MFEKLLTSIMSYFYGLMVSLGMIKDTWKYGYSAVWTKKTFDKPACLSDPSLGTHGFLKLDEVRIHYVASGPEDKPLMLFLHGFPEFWFSWRFQIREFQKDYRVVAIDQRGYGESDKPEGVDAYHVTKLLSDIRQVIQALGYKSCVLVAHDWGGGLAFPFARHFPDMVDKLIVMNAPAQKPFRRLLTTHKEQQKMSWYMFFFQLQYLPEMMLSTRKLYFLDMLFDYSKDANEDSPDVVAASDEELNAYKYTFSQPGALTPPINWYRSAFSGKNPVTYDMDYQMPLLLIWGEKDTALHVDLVAEMQKDCPKMDVKRIPEAGHFVMMQTPGLVNKAMREWLDQGHRAKL